eukprot:COSAG06_NODE_530_length_14570_cov_23.269435_8_plen_67_part_00
MDTHRIWTSTYQAAGRLDAAAAAEGQGLVLLLCRGLSCRHVATQCRRPPVRVTHLLVLFLIVRCLS